MPDPLTLNTALAWACFALTVGPLAWACFALTVGPVFWWLATDPDVPSPEPIMPEPFDYPSGACVVALVKDGERFVFLYDAASVPAVLQRIGRMAADPELNFTWYDAAVVSQRVRALQRGETPTMREPV